MKALSKKLLAVLLSVLMAASCIALPSTASAALLKEENNSDYAPGEVIVMLKETAGSGYLKAGSASRLYGSNIKLKKSFSFTGKSKQDKTGVAVLKSSKYTTAELVRKMKKNPAVKYAFPNTKKHALDITNDAYSSYQWALANTGQNGGTAGSDVNADALWEKAAASKKEQIVAVVDTGLDLTNEDLKDIAWTNTHGSRLLGKHGFDFVNEDADPQDDNGHGSHCAGIIAASADNGTGISGINKSNTKIMPVKWLDEDGSGFTEGVLASYEYINRALDLGENIVAISNSWGGESDMDEVKAFEEIFNKFGERGVISLVAAGNEAKDITDGVTVIDSIFGPMELDEPVYTVPASANSPYQLTVAASNEFDELAAFSNYSSTLVDVAAPGADILSTVSYDCFNPTIYNAEKRAALVKQMQDYDSAVSEGDFGYPKAVAIPHEKSKEFFSADFSTNISIEQTDKHFGDSGQSLTVTTQDEIEQPEDEDEEQEARLYCFEIPYTIAETAKNKKYFVSFMLSATLASGGAVADVPADTVVEDNLEDILYGAQLNIGGEKGGAYWSHEWYQVDPSRDKTTERKLVFITEAYEKGTAFTLDDFAISVQDADTADFERYDFYCGTSMATPYVAGAVALVHNAFPEATAGDVVNILKNTGRKAAALEGKVESGRVLSLENTDKIPPMIFGAKYDEKGAVVIEGSFKDVTSVRINGTAVEPTSAKQNEIVLPDNNYNTKNTTFEVENAYGKDTYTGLLSKKKLMEKTPDVYGEPFISDDKCMMIPAGDTAYFVSDGIIGSIAYDDDMGMYVYDEVMVSQLDATKLFDIKEDDNFNTYISSAVYSNQKLYFIVVRPIFTTNGNVIIGYDTAFASLDLTTGETVKLAELPEEAIFGSTLAAYNGNIYLAGGYDEEDNFLNSFYVYNTSKKAFTASTALPEGRAYTRFLQYENKLYGVYGAVKDGSAPSVIIFDGKKWTTSKAKLTSDDFTDYTRYEEKPFHVYSGNIGYGKSGLFLNGFYAYGIGDTYDYDAKNDKFVASAYAARNTLDGTKLVGTTLPGCFIGYELPEPELNSEEYEDFHARARAIICGDSIDDGDLGGDFATDSYLEDTEPVAYKLNITTAYAKVDSSAVKNAVVSVTPKYVNYGEALTVTLKPSKNYVVQSISANGAVVSKNSNKATFRIAAATVKLTASVKYVAPAKVTGVKAKAKNNKVTVSWKKVKGAKGYRVQQYKKGKWKTVKTIKKGKTVKCTVKAKKGTKFRVCAYGKYNGKTYYGKYSKTAKAK